MAKAGDVILVAAVMLIGARCLPSPDPDPNTPDPSCVAACTHLRDLGCEEGQPTDDGATCEEVCENGMSERYDLGCVAEVIYCDMTGCELDP